MTDTNKNTAMVSTEAVKFNLPGPIHKFYHEEHEVHEEQQLIQKFAFKRVSLIHKLHHEINQPFLYDFGPL